MIRRAALVAVVAILAAAQSGRGIPECKGEECHDDSTSYHYHQPLWCQAEDSGGYVHNCDCMKAACDRDGAPGGGDMPQCSVYCRKKACRCKKPCQTE